MRRQVEIITLACALAWAAGWVGASEQRSPKKWHVVAQVTPAPKAEPAPATPFAMHLKAIAELPPLPPPPAPSAAVEPPAAPVTPVAPLVVVPAPGPAAHSRAAVGEEYRVGIDDVLDISVLQPEELTTTVTVGPDGWISFPFIGSVPVKGLTIAEVQEDIQTQLADGYMKYPVVSVSLKESRSRKFFVHGEVIKPGSYTIEENMTILRAIAMAGGFTKYGSSSRVKLLRPKTDGAGYQTEKVNIKEVMEGDASQDLLLQPGDIVLVSEGMF